MIVRRGCLSCCERYASEKHHVLAVPAFPSFPSFPPFPSSPSCPMPTQTPPASTDDNGPMPTIRVATRKSPLALWQSEHAADLLRAAHPGLEVVLVPMTTRGDEVLDRSLAAIGGKGLFLKELELAMLRGDARSEEHTLNSSH